jgi:integrase
LATKHAKILDDQMFNRLLAEVAKGETSFRDQAMILLSYKAGLRAQEIAGLDWTDVCDAEGNVRTDLLFVPSDIAKKGRERLVPMHPHLSLTLTMLRATRPGDVGVIYGVAPAAVGFGQQRDKRHVNPRMSPDAVRKWFARLYHQHSLEGCSSHSGRRTFITRLARRAGQHDCSIKDVQMLAGHANLGTTELYIEPSLNVGRLVAAI